MATTLYCLRDFESSGPFDKESLLPSENQNFMIVKHLEESTKSDRVFVEITGLIAIMTICRFC